MVFWKEQRKERIRKNKKEEEERMRKNKKE
jgi:hypothetical protein